jgi:peptide/nickel transport system permease protein
MAENLTSVPIAPVAVASLQPPEVTVWQRLRESLLGAGWPILAMLILSIMTFLAIFGPQIAPKDPNRQSLIERLTPPMTANEDGVIAYTLGTDGMGRDLLSRLIYGARVSLLVGFSAMLIGGILGTTLGIIAGYFGGILDDVIMRLADIQLAFPFILLTIMVLVVLGAGVLNLVLVLGVGQWVTYARIARAQTLSQKEKEFVEAARSIGARDWEIIFRAVLPNILAPQIVIASFNVVRSVTVVSWSGGSPHRAHMGWHPGRKPRSTAGWLLVAGAVPWHGDYDDCSILKYSR